MIPNILNTITLLGNSTNLTENIDLINSYFTLLWPQSRIYIYIDSQKIISGEQGRFILVGEQEASIPKNIEKTSPLITAIINKKEVFAIVDMVYCFPNEIKSNDKTTQYIVRLGECGFAIVVVPSNIKFDDKTFNELEPLFHKIGFVTVNCLNFQILSNENKRLKTGSDNYEENNWEKQFDSLFPKDESLIQQLISSLNDYFWIYDFNEKKFVYSDPNFYKVFGQNAPHPAKNTFRFLKAIQPSDYLNFKNILRNIENQEKLLFDFRISVSGKIKTIRVKIFSIIDLATNYRRYAGIASDITAQIETEEILFETSQQLINTITSMGDRLYLVDENQRIINQIPYSSNPYFINKCLKEVDIPKEAKRLILHAFQILKYSSQPISYDVIAKNEQRNYWYSLTITRREYISGNFGGVAVHAREITQKIEAQEELKIASNIDEIIANTSTRFINLPVDKIDKEINHVLEQIGYYLAVDYAFVYLNTNNTNLQLSQSWYRKLKDIRPKLPDTLSLRRTKCFSKRLKKGEEIIVSSIRDISEYHNYEINLLSNLKIQSLALAPIIVEKKTAGFIGFATYNNIKQWNKHQVRLIKLLGEIFANALNRKNKQELLDIANSKLKTVIQNLNSGILLENKHNIIEHINQRFCNLFHIKSQPSILIGTESNSINHFIAAKHKDYDYYLQNILKNKEDLKPNINQELYFTDGKVFEQDYTPILYNNDIDGHLWQYRDITERKNTEKQIIESELRLKYALEAGNEAIWEWSILRDTLYLSPRWYEITNITPNSINTIQKCVEIVASEHKNQVEIKLNEIKDGLINRFEIEYRINTPNISDIWVLMQGKITEYQHNIPTKIVGTLNDISEEKQLQIQLIDQRAKAEEATEAKSRFLANISHEIRTPMHGVLGLIELLYGTKLTHDQHRYIEAMKLSSKNMLAILNDLLDMSKITAGKVTTEKTDFDISNIVSTLYFSLFNQAKSRHNELKLEIDNSVSPILIGDPVRLNQILLNLLNNALKFTESGKVICKISLKKESKNIQLIRFAVYDNGIGIKDEDIKNVFERFNQGSKIKTWKYGGTGLGLTISKQLVELLGGQLYVKSAVNQGTVFWFNLQLQVGKIQNKQEHTGEQTLNLVPKSKKIVVAEDDPTNVLIIQTALRNLGNEPVIVNNGSEVIDELQRNIYDLIIMDIQMPLLDGYEATKTIRQKLKLTTPIIGLSAETDKTKIKKYLKIGMNDFISKPVDLGILINVVNNQLTDEVNELQTIEPNVAPTFSMDKIRYLTNNNRDQIGVLIDTFLDNTSKNVIFIKEAYEKRDLETVYKIAHRIKPAIDTLDIVPLNKIIRQLEQNAQKQINNKQTETYVNETIRIITEVCKDLRKIKANI